MKVKAWKAGGYGIRVGLPNARLFFPKSWKSINVVMGRQTHTFKLSRTFWTTCPEFRGKHVEHWLKLRKATSWAFRKPPAFTLSKIGGNTFQLH